MQIIAVGPELPEYQLGKDHLKGTDSCGLGLSFLRDLAWSRLLSELGPLSPLKISPYFRG